MITAHSGADGTKENSLEFVAYAMHGWEKTEF